MRQARGTEHQRETKRNGVDRLGEAESRRQVLAGRVGLVLGQIEDVDRVPADLRKNEDREDGRTRHQQNGLDDLHPRRREHAAEDDVDEHEDASRDDRDVEVDAHQRVDQGSGTDHLRDQIEGGDRERSERSGDPCRPLVQAEREDVGDRELAGVPHPLGSRKSTVRNATRKPTE